MAPMTASHLFAVIDQMEACEHIPSEAVKELERLLDVLREHGWSGAIAADTAARVAFGEQWWLK